MPSLSEDHTLLELMQEVVAARLRSFHTWMPALVNEYDETKQIVQCTGQMKLPYRDRTDGNKIKWEPAPRVANCPVGFFGAQGFRITLPIEPGKTTGILLWAECPFDVWLDQGSVVEPSGTRRFHIADAMFLPVLRPNSQAYTDVPKSDSMTVGRDGGPQLVITKDLVQLGGTPSSPPDDFVALAPATKSELTKLHDAMNSGFSKIRSDLSSIKTHVHSVETAGTPVKHSGITQPAVSLQSMQDPEDAGDVGDVKASVTKAK